MKTFDNPVLKTEFINEFGEKMTLVMGNDAELWFHHEDCNKDFEPLKKAHYVLSREEQDVVSLFIQMSLYLLERVVNEKNLQRS
jgi:hypothetical protein